MTKAVLALGVAALAIIGAGSVAAQTYPRMAPIEQYRMASAAEVALARSAAPPSIADQATVLVFGPRGYETAAPGTNGFVCMVQRAWQNDFDNGDFWNPKVRTPICFNAAAARSVLPASLKRTEWVLAGLPREEIANRVHAMFGTMTPEIGSMCYMMSKQGYLSDDVRGPWRPHLMYFLPATDAASWGANQPGSPVYGGGVGRLSEPVSVFLTPVARWSDGSLDEELERPEHRHAAEGK